MSLANIPSYLLTAVVFLVMISVLVAAHEYGHYLLARFFNMGVEEFAIGMGKKVKVWRRKTYELPVSQSYVHDLGVVSHGAALEGGDHPAQSELVETGHGPALRETTEFTVRMLPVGGFVRIKGMVPQDDGSEVNIPGGFYSKPPWQRLVVLIAGPAASVVSGLLVLICALMIQGVEKPINRPVISEISPDTVASTAGLKDNDRIVAIDDKPITTFYDLVKAINSHGGQKLKLTYVRGVQGGSVYVTPNITDGPTFDSDLEIGPEITRHGVIGVGPIYHHVSLGLAGATHEAIRIPVEAVQSIFQMVTQPAAVKEEAGGVITMVATTHAATQAGPGSVVVFACLLSISVGIFNLLPFPPLDGGQMLMAFAELLRGGRRLSIQVQQTLVNAGMLLVILLFLIVGFVDVQRYAGPSRSPASVPPTNHAAASPHANK